MQPTSSKKTIIIVVILCVIGALCYFYFTGTPQGDTTVASAGTPESVDASATGARILGLLNQISVLKIDTSLFTSSLYTSLVDHTVPIYEQNVGKSNPFYTAPVVKSRTTR